MSAQQKQPANKQPSLHAVLLQDLISDVENKKELLFSEPFPHDSDLHLVILVDCKQHDVHSPTYHMIEDEAKKQHLQRVGEWVMQPSHLLLLPLLIEPLPHE